MKASLILAAGLALWAPLGAAPSAALAKAPAPVGIPGHWTLVFDDEFDGGALDPAKWTKGWIGCAAGGVTAPVNSAERDAYDPRLAVVEGGELSLTLIRRPVTVCGKTYPYRAGLIQSDGKAAFTFGAFEARIFLPAAPAGRIANWPAWWTAGQNSPIDGEMDIVEGLGGSACAHFHSRHGAPGFCAKGAFTGWHTYGADWAPGAVTYYYDGAPVGTIAAGITSAPMYLILDYAIGRYGGPLAAPATMRVKYVRVWRH